MGACFCKRRHLDKPASVPHQDDAACKTVIDPATLRLAQDIIIDINPATVTTVDAQVQDKVVDVRPAVEDGVRPQVQDKVVDVRPAVEDGVHPQDGTKQQIEREGMGEDAVLIEIDLEDEPCVDQPFPQGSTGHSRSEVKSEDELGTGPLPPHGSAKHSRLDVHVMDDGEPPPVPEDEPVTMPPPTAPNRGGWLLCGFCGCTGCPRECRCGLEDVSVECHLAHRNEGIFDGCCTGPRAIGQDLKEDEVCVRGKDKRAKSTRATWEKAGPAAARAWSRPEGPTLWAPRVVGAREAADQEVKPLDYDSLSEQEDETYLSDAPFDFKIIAGSGAHDILEPDKASNPQIQLLKARAVVSPNTSEIQHKEETSVLELQDATSVHGSKQPSFTDIEFLAANSAMDSGVRIQDPEPHGSDLDSTVRPVQAASTEHTKEVGLSPESTELPYEGTELSQLQKELTSTASQFSDPERGSLSHGHSASDLHCDDACETKGGVHQSPNVTQLVGDREFPGGADSEQDKGGTEYITQMEATHAEPEGCTAGESSELQKHCDGINDEMGTQVSAGVQCLSEPHNATTCTASAQRECSVQAGNSSTPNELIDDDVSPERNAGVPFDGSIRPAAVIDLLENRQRTPKAQPFTELEACRPGPSELHQDI